MARQAPGIQERRRKDGSIAYRAQVRVRGHEHLTETFDRKSDALIWLERTRTRIRDGNVVSTEAQRTTLEDALDRYAKEVTPGKKDSKRELNRIKAWKRHRLAKRFLANLRGKDFADYRDDRLAGGLASNTVRLDLVLISHLFKRAAKDWGMETLRNPIQVMTLPAGSNERDRRLEQGEEEKLLTALAAEGPYMAPLATLAIETAMRQSEILGLTAAAVDLDKRIAKLADTKNGEARAVPLSTKAAEVLKALPAPIAGGPLFPVTQHDVIRAFRRACDAAGLVDLKFHDLRHEAVSRLFERGLNVAEVAAISGHKTWSQLRRYTQLKAEDLARKLA
jgi:integrase